MQRHSIGMFLAGGAFAFAVTLSCNDHSHITADANLADASAADSGSATCCSSITVSGVTKTISAESDGAQLRSGILPLPAGSFGMLLPGPFELTTLMQNLKSHTNSTVAIEFYLSTGDCVADAASRKTFFTLTNSATAPGMFSGRFWIPAGTNLCFVSSANPPYDELNLAYSGFVPY
jgi:hypothetical protein